MTDVTGYNQFAVIFRLNDSLIAYYDIHKKDKKESGFIFVFVIIYKLINQFSHSTKLCTLQ
jgi:hypothetical protein